MMKSKATFGFILVLFIGIIALSGCTDSLARPKECGSDWECIKSSLDTCSPMTANIKFYDSVNGYVEGQLEIIGHTDL